MGWPLETSSRRVPPIAAFMCCVAMAIPQVHIVAYCGDLGYGPARGATMLSLMLGFGVISRLGSGFIADRIYLVIMHRMLRWQA